MKSLTAVVFGAGKAACGLLGQVLMQSGFNNVFVARKRQNIDSINNNQGYTLQFVGGNTRRLSVQNCSALFIHELDTVANMVANADIVFTAVGIGNINAIAPVIAEGLWRRSKNTSAKPLNVIACENLPGASNFIRHQVVSAAPLEKEMMVEHIGGFTAGFTLGIITGGDVENGRLHFVADHRGAEGDLVIDSRGLKGKLPILQGVTFTKEFTELFVRKIFTINCAQAVAAYLGHQEGCTYIHEAARHPRVRPVIEGAMDEARRALKASFPHHAPAIERSVKEALQRIADSSMADTIKRVARQPRRKLSPNERLVGPARLAWYHGLPYTNLCRAIAGAIAYWDQDDPQSMLTQRAIARDGPDKVLTEDCGLLPYWELTQVVKKHWRNYQSTAVQAHIPGYKKKVRQILRDKIGLPN